MGCDVKMNEETRKVLKDWKWWFWLIVSTTFLVFLVIFGYYHGGPAWW